jgi:DNA modification methylase
MDKFFAPEFVRDENNWILFPRDKQERQSLFFPEEVMRHPAKMNFHLQQAIIEYVAKPGDVLLDPFGGTGTLMIAALQGCRVILIEIEEGYHKLEIEAKNNLAIQMPGAEELVILLHGDCRLLLPIPCNHIITSPPYASAMNIRKVRKKRKDAPDDWLVEQDRQMLEYSKSFRNISKLNTFLYNMEAEKIYRLCYQSLAPGGTLTIVIKDRIEGGKRVHLGKWVAKVCNNLGMEQILWEKWKAPGHGFTSIARSQGKQVVDDEDIITYRKVK